MYALQWLNRSLVALVLCLLKGYRYLLSPWLGNQCRFYPSCSHYAEAAYKEHGFIRGTTLTVIRLCKCNPLHPGGFDEVPPPEAATKPKPTPCIHNH